MNQVTQDIAAFISKIKNVSGKMFAIDYGLRNVGLAISDADLIVAFPLKIVSPEEIIAQISQIIKQGSIAGVVIGWPKKKDGSGVHAIGDSIIKLANSIVEIFGYNVLLFDERMSTVGSKRLIYSHISDGDRSARASRKQPFKIVKDDHFAAQYILQDILKIMKQ